MPSDAPAWSLHSRLKDDTIDIGDLPLCRVLVIKDGHYPWLLLVPRRADVVEIIDLEEVEQAPSSRLCMGKYNRYAGDGQAGSLQRGRVAGGLPS